MTTGFADVAEKLETAYDREAMLRTFDDPPDGLAELRGALLVEHEGGCARASELLAVCPPSLLARLKLLRDRLRGWCAPTPITIR